MPPLSSQPRCRGRARCRPSPRELVAVRRTLPHTITVACRCAAASDATGSSSNGTPPPSEQQQPFDDADDDDPVAAMLAAAQAGGYKVVFEGQQDEEQQEDVLDDLLEDLEDPWMRNPSPPEWSESALFAAPAAAAEASSVGSDPPAVGGGVQFATVDWQQLQQLACSKQQGQHAPRVLLLEVVTPEQPQQDHEGPQAQQQLPRSRPLPDPLPLASTTVSVQRERLALPDLTRQAAAAWQPEFVLVCVWDGGHHSSLAAAIRLSAVYQLPNVVLLQDSS